MSSEIKIILYILFVVCLFLIEDITFYLFILFAILIFSLRIPFKSLKSGWIPISILILFTFISNVIFQHGKIIWSIGPIVITEEGINITIIRTMRVFFMIAAAKILVATTNMESLIVAAGKILKPFERLGIPVNDFFSTMSLTMKSFPKLKDHIIQNYRNKIKACPELVSGKGDIKGFWNRAKIVSMFLLPLLAKSIQSPEAFFKEESDTQLSRITDKRLDAS
ncbi:MAG: energy-coupling factor transporter transmembrane component T [Nitrospirota bacterium]